MCECPEQPFRFAQTRRQAVWLGFFGNGSGRPVTRVEGVKAYSTGTFRSPFGLAGLDRLPLPG